MVTIFFIHHPPPLSYHHPSFLINIKTSFNFQLFNLHERNMQFEKSTHQPKTEVRQNKKKLASYRVLQVEICLSYWKGETINYKRRRIYDSKNRLELNKGYKSELVTVHHYSRNSTITTVLHSLTLSYSLFLVIQLTIRDVFILLLN